MVRVCLCLLTGVLALQLSSFPPDSDLFVALLVALIVVLPCLKRCDVFMVFLGGLYFWINADFVVDSRLDPTYVGDSMLADVRVIDFPSSNGSTTSFIATADTDTRIPTRVRLTWFEPPVAVRVGDVWRLELRLRRPRGSSNPGSMDFEAWLFRERIGATGYVVSGRHNLLLDSGTAPGVTSARERFVERIQQLLDDPISESVIAAIVVGARHLVTDSQWDRYARTGTSHLMAISGLHVGLAAVAAYLLVGVVLGLFGYRGNHQNVALVVALLIAASYALISGFAVPARRAVLMLAFASTSLLMYRQVDPVRILAAAAMIVIGGDPLATMAPGFKLSFAAVGLLFWLARRQRAPISNGLLRPLFAIRDLAVVQVTLLLGLLPLTVLIFDRLSLVAPSVNLIAVPLFSAMTVPLALIGLLCDGPLAVFGDFALHAAAHSIAWLDKLIIAAAAHQHGAFVIADVVAEGGSIAWLYLILPVIWVLLPPRWPGRWLSWLGLAALLMWQPAAPPNSCVDIKMLDVGQGLAVVVRTNERVLLYDTGPSYRSGGAAAERIVLPYLASRSIHKIDQIVVSHSDLDHAGGVQVLVDTLDVGNIMSGDPLPWFAPVTRRCLADTVWTWNQVRFSILHPQPGATRVGNDASCVLLIEAGGHKALLTGDIESAVEATLVSGRRLPEVDIVTVPHHGSRTSSINPFVQSLMPSLALVSAAAGNQWGFPKPDVVARWQGIGATVLNTATSGAIGVRMCADDGLSPVREHRKRSRRIWHDDV
ncbi:MAG: DNA internalization-related competence protein ComEC/Rec2 [Gammaproteobacteria bacterium]|nr:DNA internalization-related competence protein ComEC/Rec2 [Gammaproteobacteria bacterium]